MRKLDFCLCENKDADQLHGNREADQRLCFRYTDSTIPLLLKSEISSFYPASVTTGRFVSDLVGNPEDRFSRVAAHTGPGANMVANMFSSKQYPHWDRNTFIQCSLMALNYVHVIIFCLNFTLHAT